MSGNQSRDQVFAWYILLALGVLFLVLAGYAGYVNYPRFNLPAVVGSGLLVLAAAAGIASFFSPCSFPLLLTLLARETQRGEETVHQPFQSAVSFATALAFGASFFLLLTGAAIAFGGGSLFAQVTFTSTAGRVIRFVIGALLMLLGLIQLEAIAVSFHGVEDLARPLLRAQSQLRREYPALAFAIFGFAYLITGFG